MLASLLVLGVRTLFRTVAMQGVAGGRRWPAHSILDPNGVTIRAFGVMVGLALFAPDKGFGRSGRRARGRGRAGCWLVIPTPVVVRLLVSVSDREVVSTWVDLDENRAANDVHFGIWIGARAVFRPVRPDAGGMERIHRFSRRMRVYVATAARYYADLGADDFQPIGIGRVGTSVMMDLVHLDLSHAGGNRGLDVMISLVVLARQVATEFRIEVSVMNHRDDALIVLVAAGYSIRIQGHEVDADGMCGPAVENQLCARGDGLAVLAERASVRFVHVRLAHGISAIVRRLGNRDLAE